MDRELAIRALGLYAPIALWGVLWLVMRPSRASERTRVLAGVLLACSWSAPALLAVHRLATRAEWWTFHVNGGTLSGFPVDLYLGWIVLWAVIPVISLSSLPLPAAALIMVWVDLLVMPLAEPVVTLGRSWIAGEFLAISVVLIPALCLARWTIADRFLSRRVMLQVLAFAGLVMYVVPSVAFEYTGGTWSPLVERSTRINSTVAQFLALPAVLGLSAVQEFAARGGGTPMPYDPPRRLVATGAYAYVANPMQIAMCLVFLSWALMVDNVWIAAAGVMSAVYGAGLAAWHEDEELTRRFGAEWIEYRRSVRPWLPRWRPYIRSRARLYVAEQCDLCRDVARWFRDRGVTGLEIVPAEIHPDSPLLRMTYEPGDGSHAEEGVAAFARALEHINFAWAFGGMFMRLPLVRPAVQLLADASGGYPRRTGTSNVSGGECPREMGTSNISSGAA